MLSRSLCRCESKTVIKSIGRSSCPARLRAHIQTLLCLCKIVVIGNRADEKTVVLSYVNLYQYIKLICKFLFCYLLFKHSSFKAINRGYYRFVLSI